MHPPYKRSRISKIPYYGSGTFGDFLNPINPLRDGGTGFDWALENILRFDREMQFEDPGDYPWAIHPEPGGIFPWATTDNGDTLYWLTRGHPDEWSVAGIQMRGPDRVLYPFGVVEFLTRWFAGELTGSILPAWSADTAIGFRPPRDCFTVTIYFADAAGTFEERSAKLRDHFGATLVALQATASQRHFLVGPAKSRITYSEMGAGYGAWLSLLFPIGEESHVYDLIRQIPARLGWPIREVMAQGRPLWDNILLQSEGRGRRRR